MVLALGLGAVSCSEASTVGQWQLALQPTANVVVDVDTRHQVIDGFGASSAWTAQSLNDVEADLLFSREAGLGLSLLRLRIAPTGSTWEQGAALKAHQRGVGIWAAPWSPPGAWKTNGSDFNGGSLLPERYQDWADRLALFAKNKQLEGIQLLGISAQNEPDWVAEWETCEWTPEELALFIADYLGPALREQAPGTPVIAPEAANWNSIAAYADAILSDPNAASEVGIVAVHSYGGTPYAYQAPFAAGKRFWETEISYHVGSGVDAAVYTAARIHEHLTISNVNAFHYWWLKAGEESGAVIVDGVVSPQGYALGHFSKFIRPGYVRVDAVATPPDAELLVSSYWGEDEATLVLVVINEEEGDAERGFQLKGLTPLSVTPWLTTANTTFRKQPRLLAQNPLRVTFPARSITTLVVSAEPDVTTGPGGPTAGLAGAAGSPSGVAGAAGEGGTMTSHGGTPGSSSDGAAPADSSNGRPGTSNTGSSDGAGTGSTTTGLATSGGRDEVPEKGPYASCLCSTPGDTAGAAPWLLALVLSFGAYRRRWAS